MYIKRVQLENFKVHHTLDVTLSRGINAIYGPNGAGKSSIIEAIGYALFNYRPYRSTSELIRKGAKKAIVLLDFEATVDERLYTIERHILQKGSGKYTLRDTETASVITEGAQDTQEEIRKLLDVEPESKLSKLFETILGVPQGTITSAFLLNQTDRKTIFAPLLRVEEYEQAWSAIRDQFLKPLNDQQTREQARLDVFSQQLDTIPHKERELQERSEHIENAKAQLEALNKEQPTREATVQQLRTLRDSYNSLVQQALSIRQRHTQAQHHLEQSQKAHNEALQAQQIIKETSEQHREYIEAKTAFEGVRQAQQTYYRERKELQQIEGALHRQQIDCKQLHEQITQLETQEQELTSLQPAIDQRRDLEKEIHCKKQEAQRLIMLQNRQKDLELELRSQHAEVMALERKCRELQQLIPKVEALQHIEQEGKQLRQQADEWKRDQEAFDSHQKQLKELEAQVAEIQQALCATLQQERIIRETHQPRAAQLPKIERELEQLQRQLHRLSAQIEREEQFRKSVSGGLCPFFSQPCRNVPEGQKLEQYIGNSIKETDEERRQLQRTKTKLDEEHTHAQQGKRTLESEAPLLQYKRESQEKESQKLRQLIQETKEKLQHTPNRQTELNRSQQRLQELRSHYAHLKQQTAGVNELHQQQTTLQILQTERERKEKEAIHLQTQIKECTDLTRDLPAKERTYNELDTPYQRYIQIKNGVQQLPEKRTAFEEANKQAHTLQEQIKNRNKELESLVESAEKAQQYEVIMKRTEAAYERYLHHQSNASKVAHTQHALEVAQEQLNTIAKEQASLQQEQAELAKTFSTEQLTKEEAALQDCIHHIGRISGRLPADLAYQQKQQAELDNLIKQRDQLSDDYKQLERNERVIACAEQLRKTYKAAGPHMTRTLIKSISAEADRLFRHLLNQNHLSLQWDETFELYIEENGNERGFAQLSGGEQMAAALSVRLALVKELSSVSVAFFDEPTAHLDTTRRYNLAEQLANIKGFDQLVVISHDDTFETMTDHVVYIDPNN